MKGLNKWDITLGVFGVVALFVVGMNALSIAALTNTVQEGNTISTQSRETPVLQEGIIPAGVPETYGPELGISYEDVSASNPGLADATISKMAQIDRSISLEGEQLQRYTNILYHLHNGISCEYCCGARSIIFENGQPACGCAHSYAMRGITKYLITQHGDEYTDEEIFAEVAKWKARYFPTQMQQKADIMASQGIEPTITNVASNEYRGIEKGQVSGSMVGGC